MSAKFLGVTIPPEVTTVTGGDPDGALAAGVVWKGLDTLGVVTGVQYERTVPCTLPPGSVALVDLPPDARNSRDTNLAWLRENAGQIVLVIDHHQGDDQYVEALGPERVITGQAPSCPALLAQRGFPIPAWVVAAANYCDDPTGGWPATTEATYIRQAFDVALVDLGNGVRGTLPKVNEAITAVARGGMEEVGAAIFLGQIAGRFEPIQLATAAAAEAARVVGTTTSGQAVVMASVPQRSQVANTQLFANLYKVAPVAVIRTFTPDGKPLHIIAHNLREAGPNLVQALGLKSGNPTRVPLEGDHEAVWTRIVAALGITSETK